MGHNVEGGFIVLSSEVFWWHIHLESHLTDVRLGIDTPGVEQIERVLIYRYLNNMDAIGTA